VIIETARQGGKIAKFCESGYSASASAGAIGRRCAIPGVRSSKQIPGDARRIYRLAATTGWNDFKRPFRRSS